MIILASQSPRRIDILKQAGITFKSVTPKVLEVHHLKNPKEIVAYLSKIKAEDVKKEYSEDLIIGADTVVAYKNHVLGKPSHIEEAFHMLMLLSGKTHDVHTGVTILFKECIKTFVVTSKVTMKRLDKATIKRYIETGEPMDKAGSYAIQGKGSALIKKYEGDYLNIVGLPIETLLTHIERITKEETQF